MDRKYLFQLFTVHGVSLDCIDLEYSFSYFLNSHLYDISHAARKGMDMKILCLERV